MRFHKIFTVDFTKIITLAMYIYLDEVREFDVSCQI